jgi:hypothetical protein
MKTYYYYLRDHEKKPIVSVCLIKDGEDVARGVAICSRDDAPRKKYGRTIARKRAEYAMSTKGQKLPIKRIKAMWGVTGMYSYFNVTYLAWLTNKFKACFSPILTSYEEQLLNNGNA